MGTFFIFQKKTNDLKFSKYLQNLPMPNALPGESSLLPLLPKLWRERVPKSLIPPGVVCAV